MISPNRVNGNWILWYLIVIPITYLVVKHMFDPVITLGDIIVLATTMPALAFGVWKVVAYYLYRRHPFRLEYQKQLAWVGKKRPAYKKLSLPLGNSSFIVRVQPKRPTTFKRLHLRLMDRPNINAHYPDKETISLSDVIISGEGLLSPLEGLRQDNTNGMQGNLQEDWDCSSEESLFLEVMVSSKKYWSGYLMFQSLREDKHRGNGYLFLEVGH